MATPVQRESFYCGLRVVAVDGTTLSVPDEQAVAWHYPKHGGPVIEFGYPLLRLVALVECGTRALLGAAFGPDTTGELGYAGRLLDLLDESMVLLADACYDAHDFLQQLVRVASDLVTARPGLSAQRISLTVILNAAADQIVAGRGIGLDEPVALIGAIGRTALTGLLPPGRRWRLKARVRKRNSKYTFTADKHPRKAQAYTLRIEMIAEESLDSPARAKRNGVARQGTRSQVGPSVVAESLPFDGPRCTFISRPWRSRADQSFRSVYPTMWLRAWSGLRFDPGRPTTTAATSSSKSNSSQPGGMATSSAGATIEYGLLK